LNDRTVLPNLCKRELSQNSDMKRNWMGKKIRKGSFWHLWIWSCLDSDRNGQKCGRHSTSYSGL